MAAVGMTVTLDSTADSSCRRLISAAHTLTARENDVMMNKPLSDRGRSSQILLLTLSHKGMAL